MVWSIFNQSPPTLIVFFLLLPLAVFFENTFFPFFLQHGGTMGGEYDDRVNIIA